MKIISNKKGGDEGPLPETLIRILIAVFCVVLILIPLGVKLLSPSKDTKYKQAEANLNDIIYAEIQKLNLGGIENSDGVLIQNPSGWDILGFTENKKPNSCLGEKCICICDIYAIDSVERRASKCDDGGICKVVENLVPFNSIKIEGSGKTLISIKLTEKGIEVENVK